MAETTIEWTATRCPDGRVLPGYTFNPWQGCVKVSPACTHCYAATFAKRFGVEWGPHARRKFQSESYWAEPLKWNRSAERSGIRRKVFCASMADVFEYLPEEHPDCDQMSHERGRLWALIEDTPGLDWLLLTKRPENVTPVAPDKWLHGEWPSNVWVGTTVENQEQAEKRIPELLQVPAPVRFLSCEPLLGPVDLTRWLEPTGVECSDVCPGRRYVNPDECESRVRGDERYPLCPDCGAAAQWTGYDPGIDWVIAGGESGPGARPSHPDWFRSLRDQCRAAGVPFYFKQWGEFSPSVLHAKECSSRRNDAGQLVALEFPMARVGKKAAGRLLDGRTWDQFPEVAR